MREIKNNPHKEALIRYRRTSKGLIRNLFSHIKERSFKKGWTVSFSSEEFYYWVINNERFETIYSAWCESGFLKSFRPSVDRIDCRKGYVYENMQIVTYQFNRDKGDKEKIILRGKPIIAIDVNNDPKFYNSIKECAECLKLRPSNISAVLIGQRKRHKNIIFYYADQHQELSKTNK